MDRYHLACNMGFGMIYIPLHDNLEQIPAAGLLAVMLFADEWLMVRHKRHVSWHRQLRSTVLRSEMTNGFDLKVGFLMNCQ